MTPDPIAVATPLRIDPSNAGALQAWDGGDGDFWTGHEDLFDAAVAGYPVRRRGDLTHRPGARRRLWHRPHHPPRGATGILGDGGGGGPVVPDARPRPPAGRSAGVR